MMNDEMEQLERRLNHQPLRQIPAEWRGEILAAADVDRRNVRAFTSAATIGARLREIFWPAPAAWAGLAAVWIFIFAVNFSMRDSSPRLAEKSAPPSPEVIVELRQQQRLFAELVGPRETRDADRPRIFTPKPRGGRAEILVG
jgi:hypothetical protein